jgi:hypothetical protein
MVSRFWHHVCASEIIENEGFPVPVWRCITTLSPLKLRPFDGDRVADQSGCAPALGFANCKNGADPVEAN